MFLPANSSCEGRVSLPFTQTGLLLPTSAGIVVEKESEYILAHTGPRKLDRHPLGGLWVTPPGGVWVRVWFISRLYYFLVRVCVNINSVP